MIQSSFEGFDCEHSRFGTLLCRRLGYMEVEASAWEGNEAEGMRREVKLVVKRRGSGVRVVVVVVVVVVDVHDRGVAVGRPGRSEGRGLCHQKGDERREQTRHEIPRLVVNRQQQLYRYLGHQEQEGGRPLTP